jgi:CRP-like cAMP-binding protein
MLDVFGHLAFVLILVSFLVRDIVLLRTISVAASLASITYNYLAPASPLWLVIGWNLVFMSVNGVQIALLLRERRGVEFTEQEQEIYETNFKRLSPVEFLRVLRIARWEDANSGDTLVRSGQKDADVMLIYSGRAHVEKNGQKLTELRGGDFVGEMGFLTGQAAAARVVTSEPTRLLRWDRGALRKLLDRNPSMRNALQAELSDDMARKLARRTGVTGRFAPPVVNLPAAE